MEEQFPSTDYLHKSAFLYLRSEERRVGKECRSFGIRDADVTGVQTCALPISSVLAINSLITASKKYVANFTASVSFHSSYNSKFIEDKQHTNDSSLEDGRAISEHRLLA